jgi:C2H2-type zinc finger
MIDVTSSFSSPDNAEETEVKSLCLQKWKFFKFCRRKSFVSSSELLRCKECGESFDTVESLREHMKSEKDEIKNRVKGFSDG